MYSLHGLLALMRPLFGHVCQSLIVVSNWTPGSPQLQVASAMSCSSSRAPKVSTGSPPQTVRVVHSPSSSTARMKSSVTRTEWLAFWKKTES